MCERALFYIYSLKTSFSLLINVGIKCFRPLSPLYLDLTAYNQNIAAVLVIKQVLNNAVMCA